MKESLKERKRRSLCDLSLHVFVIGLERDGIVLYMERTKRHLAHPVRWWPETEWEMRLLITPSQPTVYLSYKNRPPKRKGKPKGNVVQPAWAWWILKARQYFRLTLASLIPDLRFSTDAKHMVGLVVDISAGRRHWNNFFSCWILPHLAFSAVGF